MKPLLLMILDGWGYSENKDGNAIEMANPPNWHKLWNEWPHTLLGASGLAVGLPEGTMGNSEVGHLNLGAGRVVYQEYTRINKAIEDGTFFKNQTLKDVFGKLKASGGALHQTVQGGALHLMGLVSDIGVHSHLSHLYALIEFALREGVEKIFIHCFTDGRDSPPDSGLGYIKQIENRIADCRLQIADLKSSINNHQSSIRIASVMGRYWAMDRDKRWDRIEKAYSAIVDGVGKKIPSAVEAVEASYKEGVTDEFIVPTVIEPLTQPSPLREGFHPREAFPQGQGEGGFVHDGDAVIFFNFRADRARQLTRAMTDEKLVEFKHRIPKLTAFVTMTQYEEDLDLPVIFTPSPLTNIFGEVISNHSLHQLRIAETEKYAHVTYFFNGGEEKVFPSEDRVLIPSPRDVPTYDKKPEMSAYQVADEVVKRIESKQYDVIILNFANPDMVGHTGVLQAAIKAVEAVDICIGRVVDAVLKAGGAVLITGDHGNCEEMFDERHQPQTAHTTNLVPFVLIGKGLEKKKLREKGGAPNRTVRGGAPNRTVRGGALCDIAPTMLELLGTKKPEEMTGGSLIL